MLLEGDNLRFVSVAIIQVACFFVLSMLRFCDDCVDACEER